MEKATVVFTRLPNRKFAPEAEVREIFEPMLEAYGPVDFDGSWIMSCGPYGAGFFHKFRVGFESPLTLHDLIKLCEKPMHGFVGAVMGGEAIKFEMPSPLMVTGGTIIEEFLSAVDDTLEDFSIITSMLDIPMNTPPSVFTKDAIDDARAELEEMNERLLTLEYENRVMRAILGLEADENPMEYQGSISPIL